MVKFENLLSAVDFDYEIRKNVSALNLCLIDREGAYLGGKDSYETEIDPSNLLDAVNWAIERLESYFHDSVVKDIIENIDSPVHRDMLGKLSGYYPDMLKYISDNNVKISDAHDSELLKCICCPELINISDFKNKIDQVNEYIIPIWWSMCSSVVVKGAKNLHDAVELVRKYADDIPLPQESDYIDGSFTLSIENDEEAEAYQDYAIRGIELDVSDKEPKYCML